MDKPNSKNKLLAEGLRLVHRNGFATTSVRDVVKAAGVAQGSFTQHFASKEDFGVEVVEQYSEHNKKLVESTLDNETMKPVARIRAYVDAYIAMMKRDGNRSGCLYGNFCAETPSAGEAIRKAVVVQLAEREESVANCLIAAVAAGELAKDFDVESTAVFVIASLQGALLLAKARHNSGPLEALKSVLFEHVLVK